MSKIGKLSKVAVQLNEVIKAPNSMWYKNTESKIEAMEQLINRLKSADKNFRDMDLSGDIKVAIKSLENAIDECNDIIMAIQFEYNEDKFDI